LGVMPRSCFLALTRSMNSSRGIALMRDGLSVPKMARSVNVERFLSG